jgi:hypothetical protein
MFYSTGANLRGREINFLAFASLIPQTESPIPKAKLQDADKAIEVALSMLGISQGIAQKITTAELPI